MFYASVLASVGLNAERDVTWVVRPFEEWESVLARGEIDVLMATPPLAQRLRDKKIGHVFLNTTTDRPWSQYFGCLFSVSRDCHGKNPVATKRALRAILKASNLCALEPNQIAHTLVDRGFTKSYDYAAQTMKEVPYGKWREYEPADTVRFYALRLYEAGLKKELKG